MAIAAAIEIRKITPRPYVGIRRTAFFVASPVRSEGDITGGETAGGEALRALHVGSYGTLGETWGKVFAHAEAIKRRVTRSSWEVYLNTPAEVPAAELRTEIYVPIDPA